LLIDHHVKMKDYVSYEIIEETSAATCEIIAKILFAKNQDISKKIATHLFAGIVSDSLNFTTSSTTSCTFAIAAKLVECGADIASTKQILFSVDFNQFNFLTALRQIAILEDGLLTVKLDKKMIEDYDLSMDFAKEGVREFQNISNAEVIVLFYEVENSLYNASLRSNEININPLARKYGGGGHQKACGVKDLDYSQQIALIDDLKQLLAGKQSFLCS